VSQSGGQARELPVVLATDYSQRIAEAGSGGRPVILKPYRLAILADALSAALRQKSKGSARRRPGTARARVAPPHTK
jgi:hypothetical protein